MGSPPQPNSAILPPQLASSTAAMHSATPSATSAASPRHAAPSSAISKSPSASASSAGQGQMLQRQASNPRQLGKTQPSPSRSSLSRKRHLAPAPPVAAELASREPYLFDLGLGFYDFDSREGLSLPVDGHDTSSLKLDFGMGGDVEMGDMPAFYDASHTGGLYEPQLSLAADGGELECARCWESDSMCAECAARKQAQFNSQGWPVEQAGYFGAFAPQENFGSEELWRSGGPIKSEPMEFDEQKTHHPAELPPLSAPLFSLPDSSASTGSSEHARVQGRLTRFLPEGTDMMAVGQVDPHYQTAFDAMGREYAGEFASTSASGRPVRRRAIRSRSPSPDLSSERSATPDSFAADSAYETDQYEQEEEEHSSSGRRASVSHSKKQTLHRQRVQQHQQQQSLSPQGPLPKDGELALPDTVSPPAVRYGVANGSDSSTDSSAEPPQPTRLLPVSARELLPSRPSTAAIPPAHIKDRLVRSAKKLLTAADSANNSVQVQVIPIWYPAKGASGAHKIRLIRVENTADRTVSVYAHAADVGGVVERKSNISRLFGKFESPSEKLLMNCPGAHNHQVGQESNILTLRGVLKFLELNKMKSETVYRDWIRREMLPRLSFDPLEVGDEEVEIEASTNPGAAGRVVKPRKMKRMEQKRAKKMEEKKRAAATANTNATDAASLPNSPAPKRQKLFNSPASASSSAASTPHFSGFSSHVAMHPNPPPFALNADHSMSHAA